MQESFRQFLDRLRQTGELVDLHQPVDIRHIATLVDQADTALYFHDVIGYHMPVVSGLIRTRERSMMAMGCETYREIDDMLADAINHPIPPKYVKTSPTRTAALCRSLSASARIRSRSPARDIAPRSASTRWRSQADCAARRLSSRRARRSTCLISPTPRSCWKQKSCRPDGPGRRDASA